MKRIMKTTTISALVLLLLILCGCGVKEIDPRLYTNVEFEGLSGSGRAYISFDYDMLTTAVTDEDDKSNFQDYLLKLDVLYDAVEVTCENAEGLSNGDKIEVIYTADEEVLDAMDVKLTANSATFIVQNLKEPVKVDAFMDVDVVFQGNSPAATVTVVNNSTHEFLRDVQFTCDQTSGLSNGDTVTVTANYSIWYAESLGYALASETKEYVVEGLSEWVTSADQVDAAAREIMAQQALDMVTAELASTDGRSLQFDITDASYLPGYRSFTYTTPKKVAEVLLVNKFMGENNSNPNLYVIIYEIPVEITLDETGEVVHNGNAYYGISFNNLSFSTTRSTETNLQSRHIYSVSASMDSLYSKLVLSVADDYAIIDMLNE